MDSTIYFVFYALESIKIFKPFLNHSGGEKTTKNTTVCKIWLKNLSKARLAEDFL
jgi:hypothetical protein